MAKFIKTFFNLTNDTLDCISTCSKTLSRSLKDINLSLEIYNKTEELFQKKYRYLINKKLELKIQEQLLNFYLEYKIPAEIVNDEVIKLDCKNKDMSLLKTQKLISHIQEELNDIEELAEILKKSCELEIRSKYNIAPQD